LILLSTVDVVRDRFFAGDFTYSRILQVRLQSHNYRDSAKVIPLSDHVGVTGQRSARDLSSAKDLIEYLDYYESSNVDTIPAPIDSWLIDRNRLLSETLTGIQISVTLWVDADGIIRKIEMENSQDLTIDVQWILNSISKTPMSPATIENQPVPSVISFAIVLGE